MRCADNTCPHWKKDEDCPAAEGCAGYTEKLPCTEEERKQKGCKEWCGLPFC